MPPSLHDWQRGNRQPDFVNGNARAADMLGREKPVPSVIGADLFLDRCRTQPACRRRID